MHLFETFLAEAYGPAGSKAMGNGNFQDMWNHYRGRKSSPNLRLDFGDNRILELGDNDVNKLVDYYNELKTNDQRRDFVYQTMSSVDNFLKMLEELGIQEKPYLPTGDQLKLLEKDKTDNREVSRDQTRDPKMAAVLSRAYSKFPNASSDLEAFVRQTFDQDADQDQDIDAQASVNDRQDSLLSRLRTVSQKQSQQLAALDRENSELDAEIQDLESQLNKIGGRSQGTQAAQQVRKKKKDAQPDTEKSKEEPAADTAAAKAPASRRASNKPQSRLRPGTAIKTGAKTPTPNVTTDTPIAGTPTAKPAGDNVVQFPQGLTRGGGAEVEPEVDQYASNDPLFPDIEPMQKAAESKGPIKQGLADYIQQAHSLGDVNKLSHAAAWARRYPNLHADIAEAKKSGDHERVARLHKIKSVIDQGISEQSGLGFGQ